MPIHNKFFLVKDNDGNTVIHPGLLQQQGPVLPIEIQVPTALEKHLKAQGKEVPKPVEGLALVDTGATSTCIDHKVLTDLGVKPVGIIKTGTAGGIVEQNLFPARIHMKQEKIGVEFGQVAGVNLSGQKAGGMSIVALIGRDLLANWVLLYNGPAGMFTLAV